MRCRWGRSGGARAAPWGSLCTAYVGTGVWWSDNRHNLSVLVLTVDQDADSIHGSGLISGMLTSDEGTVTYENDYVFGGTVEPGDPAELTVSFNSGCVWNTYHGHVTEGGDMVLVGTALGTSEDCSLTGDDSEGLMYFGRSGWNRPGKTGSPPWKRWSPPRTGIGRGPENTRRESRTCRISVPCPTTGFRTTCDST